MNSRTRLIALLVVVVAGMFAAFAGSVHAAKKAGATLTIWVDQNRKDAVTQLANQWSAKNPGVTVNIVVQDFGSIRDKLGTVDTATAPDVILAAHDWTGQLAANGLVEPIYLSTAQKKQFPAYTLNAFSYGVAIKHLYGVPTQIENIGLVVNTKEAKVPTTFSQLESEALAWKKAHHTKVGIAVQQGSGGDVFGTNSAGNLDPSNIGVAGTAFIKNASIIDRWNKEGLINSSLDFSTALNLFITKKVPFYVTGPWNTQTLEQSKIPFKIIQMPKIVHAAVPFLGVQGAMVAKYATTHGVDALAQDFVANYISTPAAQLALALANGRYPANTVAGKQVHDPVLAEFGKAGVGGVPMPNIPQMNYVWSYLGQAWVNATKGSGATPAAKAFKAASHSIAEKIG
jgi:arabinogalactan oligomer/maltooligosaccharide transport system substrate-binding protein